MSDETIKQATLTEGMLPTGEVSTPKLHKKSESADTKIKLRLFISGIVFHFWKSIYTSNVKELF